MLTLPLTSSKPLIPHITCPQGCSPNPTFSKSGNGTASARVSSGAGLGCHLLWRSGVWVRQKWVWSQAPRPSCTPSPPEASPAGLPEHQFPLQTPTFGHELLYWEAQTESP